jgi:hypothetical protein
VKDTSQKNPAAFVPFLASAAVCVLTWMTLVSWYNGSHPRSPLWPGQPAKAQASR